MTWDFAPPYTLRNLLLEAPDFCFLSVSKRTKESLIINVAKSAKFFFPFVPFNHLFVLFPVFYNLIQHISTFFFEKNGLKFFAGHSGKVILTQKVDKCIFYQINISFASPN